MHARLVKLFITIFRNLYHQNLILVKQYRYISSYQVSTNMYLSSAAARNGLDPSKRAHSTDTAPPRH